MKPVLALLCHRGISKFNAAVAAGSPTGLWAAYPLAILAGGSGWRFRSSLRRAQRTTLWRSRRRTRSRSAREPAGMPLDASAGRLAVASRDGILVPRVIASAGDKAARRFLEFFAATIRNKNTRMAYYTGVTRGSENPSGR